MTKNYRQTTPRSDADLGQAWQDSQLLFLLNCYDVWSATPPRHCAALFDTDGTA